MKNEEIYNKCIEFITKHLERFLDNETQWKNILDEVKHYIGIYIYIKTFFYG